MKIQTQELTDLALNWAVAEANGTPIYRSGKTLSRMDTAHLIVYWQPTIDWSQGGPIIEREGMTLIRYPGWTAVAGDVQASGPTLLIAAMRCYVASKLGDTVDIPEELS